MAQLDVGATLHLIAEQHATVLSLRDQVEAMERELVDMREHLRELIAQKGAGGAES